MRRIGLWMMFALGLAAGPQLAYAQGDPNSQPTAEETPTPSSHAPPTPPAPGSESARRSTGEPAEASAGIAYRLKDGQIVVRSSNETVATIDPPCRARAITRNDSELYVACGDKGLSHYSPAEPHAPEGVGFRDLGGTVDALFEARDRVWAELVHTEARPVG